MSKKKGNKVSLKQDQATTQVSQPKEINSDTGNVQFISEGIGLEDLVKIEGKNSNNVVKGEENEMNKAQETQRTHNEVVVEAKQQEEQAKVASAVKKVEEAKKEDKPVETSKEKTVALTEKQIAEMVKNAKELAKAELQLEQAKEESKVEAIPAKVEGGKQEMYKQTAAMNSNEVQVPDNNTVTISKADLDDLIKKAVENAAKANANLPAPQVAIKEEVKEEPKKEEVVEKKEAKEESEENDYIFFFGAAVGAAAVYGGQKLYEYLNDDSAADDASEAFSLISDMF
jgi:hypothetical protein